MAESNEIVDSLKRNFGRNFSSYNFFSDSRHRSQIEDLEDNIYSPCFDDPSYITIKTEIEETRKWFYTDTGKYHISSSHFGHHDNNLCFTVMSYNILSQTIMKKHPFLYRHCDPEYLSWDYRLKNLLHEMNNSNCDIMCLQEVQENHYKDDFLPYLSRKGYFGSYKKKTGECNNGCAIFFKTNVFRLESKYGIEFDNTPTIDILDRNNVALIAVLKPKMHVLQNHKLICATTHLPFSPQRGDIKIAQLRLLLATVEKLAYKNTNDMNIKEYHPIIFCGNINCEPCYPLYDFIVQGYLKYVNVLTGNISGQRDGFHKGWYMTRKALSLDALSINQNTCYEESQSGDHSNISLENWAEQTTTQFVLKNDSKYFYHPLSFASAYKHFTNNGQREITVGLPRELCNADYIFYSVDRKVSFQSAFDKKVYRQEGVLKHLGSYGLPLESDVDCYISIPNIYLSSGHFSLISWFLLSNN